MNLDDMEQKIREHDVKLFILCSPHNPVGRVWTKDELAAAGRLCEKYDVIVVSDEIHSDFTYGGLTHTVFPSISPQLAERTILCTAPSKTFNLAGLQVSNIFVPDQKLRRAMRRAIDQTGYGNLNMMGLAACQAAYEEGEEWLQDLKRYLTDNLTYLRLLDHDSISRLSERTDRCRDGEHNSWSFDEPFFFWLPAKMSAVPLLYCCKIVVSAVAVAIDTETADFCQPLSYCLWCLKIHICHPEREHIFRHTAFCCKIIFDGIRISTVYHLIKIVFHLYQPLLSRHDFLQKPVISRQ